MTPRWTDRLQILLSHIELKDNTILITVYQTEQLFLFIQPILLAQHISLNSTNLFTEIHHKSNNFVWYYTTLTFIHVLLPDQIKLSQI